MEFVHHLRRVVVVRRTDSLHLSAVRLYHRQIFFHHRARGGIDLITRPSFWRNAFSGCRWHRDANGNRPAFRYRPYRRISPGGLLLLYRQPEPVQAPFEKEPPIAAYLAQGRNVSTIVSPASVFSSTTIYHQCRSVRYHAGNRQAASGRRTADLHTLRNTGVLPSR